MKNGICPKCGKADVHTKAGGFNQRDILALSLWHTVPIDNYVCTRCGYLESYVREGGLATIGKNWRHVEPKESWI